MWKYLYMSYSNSYCQQGEGILLKSCLNLWQSIKSSQCIVKCSAIFVLQCSKDPCLQNAESDKIKDCTKDELNENLRANITMAIEGSTEK